MRGGWERVKNVKERLDKGDRSGKESRWLTGEVERKMTAWNC